MFAQDLHFSQFNENPSLVNPALAGVANPFRASVSYKDQWRSVSSPYRTFGVSFDTRLNNSSWQQVDKHRSMTFKERSLGRLAWGFSVYGDKAGAGQLRTTESSFLVATFVPMGPKSHLSMGIRASSIQKSIENGSLVFPSQFNGSSYDKNMPQNERFQELSYQFVDLAAGGLWSFGQNEKRLASDPELRAKAGFACYHITGTHNSYYYYRQMSTLRYVMHGDFIYSPANFNTAIAPSFLIQMQGSTFEAVGGIMLKYYFSYNSRYTGNNKRSALGYGVYYRNNDALILSALFEKNEQYQLGFSYDVNVSRLVTASTGRGGFEVSLRYTPPKAFLYQKKTKATE